MQRCTFSGVPRVPLQVIAFDTEYSYDFVIVNVHGHVWGMAVHGVVNSQCLGPGSGPTCMDAPTSTRCFKIFIHTRRHTRLHRNNF